MKLEPETERKNAEVPASADDGLSETTAGDGFGIGEMVNVRLDEVEPPVLASVTATDKLPGVARSAACNVVCKLVDDSYTVALADPFKAIAEVVRKFVPIAVSVNSAEPTRAIEGVIETKVGAAGVPAPPDPEPPHPASKIGRQASAAKIGWRFIGYLGTQIGV